jgi:hypothetical protein
LSWLYACASVECLVWSISDDCSCSLQALELNGQYLEGREVHCEVAREREDRSQSAGKNWNSPAYVMNFSFVLSIFLETTNADQWCLTLSFGHQILPDNIQVIEDTLSVVDSKQVWMQLYLMSCSFSSSLVNWLWLVFCHWCYSGRIFIYR